MTWILFRSWFLQEIKFSASIHFMVELTIYKNGLENLLFCVSGLYLIQLGGFLGCNFFSR